MKQHQLNTQLGTLKCVSEQVISMDTNEFSLLMFYSVSSEVVKKPELVLNIQGHDGM
jgi:hypothetical protein